MAENNWLIFLHIPFLLALLWLGGRGLPLPLRNWARLGGLLRVSAGLLLGWLYQHAWDGGGDTWGYHAEALRLWELLSDSPGAYFEVFLGKVPPGEWLFARQPRALFFAAVMAFPVALAGGNYYIASAYVTLVSWLGLMIGMRGLHRAGYAVGPWLVALCLWPSIIFWSSGILKETLMLGVIGVILSQLPMLLGQASLRGYRMLLLLITFWFLWQLKYYVAGVAFASLGALSLGQWVEKRFMSQKLAWWCFGGGWLLLLAIASITYPKLYVPVVLQSLYDNYLLFHALGDAPQVVSYPFWDGTLVGALLSVPTVLGFGLFWPLPGGHWSPSSLLAGLENLTLLVMVVVAAVNGKRNKGQGSWGITRIQASGLIYGLVMLLFVGLATPNLGTWMRYKVMYLPLLIAWLLPHLGTSWVKKFRLPFSDLGARS